VATFVSLAAAKVAGLEREESADFLVFSLIFGPKKLMA